MVAGLLADSVMLIGQEYPATLAALQLEPVTPSISGLYSFVIRFSEADSRLEWDTLLRFQSEVDRNLSLECGDRSAEDAPSIKPFSTAMRALSATSVIFTWCTQCYMTAIASGVWV